MLLELDNVSVAFDGALALDSVCLGVAEGEVVGLVGSNGAGKTSLLNAVSAAVPYTGSIVFEGRELSSLKAHQVARLGIAHAPEGRRLFPYLSVEENLDLGAYTLAGKAGERDRERVYTLFPRLADLRRRAAGTLSGGEQQMVAIGRALMLRPRLLILDEPSLGLAPMLLDTIYDSIRELGRARQTILLAEQNVAECLDVSDRVYVLQTGSIVRCGTAADLRSSAEVRRAFLGR